MSSSEQQPLIEGGAYEEQCSPSRKERVAKFVETPVFHKFVICLILIDAGCAYVDISYALLTPGCAPEDPESPKWLEVLSYVSIIITTLFLLEIPLALYSFGLDYYNPRENIPHAPLHAFDAFIIIVTFVLEVVLRGKERELAELLIILRIWRLVKLVGNVAVSAGEIQEGDTKAIEEELDRTRVQLKSSMAENAKFRDKLLSLGANTDVES